MTFMLLIFVYYLAVFNCLYRINCGMVNFLDAANIETSKMDFSCFVFSDVDKAAGKLTRWLEDGILISVTVTPHATSLLLL